MKKYSLILAILMVLSFVLSACGGAGQTADSKTPSEPTKAPEISEELGNELSSFSSDVIDPDLTCTITLGNWPPDTAAASELALFEDDSSLRRYFIIIIQVVDIKVRKIPPLNGDFRWSLVEILMIKQQMICTIIVCSSADEFYVANIE